MEGKAGVAEEISGEEVGHEVNIQAISGFSVESSG